jgi:hypothetical protein
MADDKKKPGLAMVIEEGKKAANGEQGEDGDEESTESFDATASEMFDAIKNDDVEGFKEALRAAIKSC